ncbi:PREDICTED: uncharacterized protein LOC109184855 [Ipomoea nil]|uniref:uncharacterized protein LOC109184855 n=1 Tax=Ipomoea nil TaxID=35883 RepID=UPI000901233F|nr:PREDICTED: uncharacterized protein LOC109184855 [Ipomoea nil]
MEVVIESIPTRVTDEDNAILLSPVSMEEVRNAVFHMHPDKSPGPDGFGPGFFQHFWDIVGGEVTMFCRSNGLLHGVRVARGAPQISHLLFADDCFLFLRANTKESIHMKWVLDTYSAASGQQINFDKLILCFSANVHAQTRNDVVDALGVREGNTSGKYLGLPSLVGRNKKVILAYLKDKIVARVCNWNTRFLSPAGREVLLKTVIQTMPSYAMMVFLLPLGLCREIETIMNEYWWTRTTGNGKGIKWKSWNGLCAPKSRGGMGFRKLHEMNLACSNPSFIWRGMLEVQSVLKKGCMDPWLPVELEPYVQTALHETIANAPVSSLLNAHGTGWDAEYIRDIFDPCDVERILNIIFP